MALAEQNQINTNITQDTVLTVTPAAVSVIHNLLEQRNIPEYALRVFVSGGGCSGMQYGMSFVETPETTDTVVAVDNIRLVIDPTSMIYLKGVTIDFVDSLIGGGFRIDNPNAVSQCGCGSSFRSGNEETDASADTGSCGSCSSY